MNISVVIPTYNRVSVLSRALKSVFFQKESALLGKLDVIVVDDGSEDETESMVNRDFPQASYVYQTNQGVSAARNNGIALARHDWIALLDSDDEWLPRKLQNQIQAIHSSGLKVCHTEEIWVRDGVRVNQMNKHRKAGGDIFERCLQLCAMSPSSILVHRDVLDHVGHFDPELPACEDYDLWLRITAHYKVDYVKEPCIKKFGGHSDQLSRAFWGMDRFRVKALAKLLGVSDPELMLNKQQRAAARSMLIKKNAILLNGARKHGNVDLENECLARVEQFYPESA